MPLQIRSVAFTHNGAIPRIHTCDGDDTPPPLQFSGAPAGTRSLALIVADPAAPKRVFVHWILYDMPPDAPGIDPAGALPNGTRTGVNDAHTTDYSGPCPPIGRHRYFFKLYALDTMLGDLGSPTKADLERAMQGHILEQAELIGTYERSR